MIARKLILWHWWMHACMLVCLFTHLPYTLFHKQIQLHQYFLFPIQTNRLNKFGVWTVCLRPIACFCGNIWWYQSIEIHHFNTINLQNKCHCRCRRRRRQQHRWPQPMTSYPIFAVAHHNLLPVWWRPRRQMCPTAAVVQWPMQTLITYLVQKKRAKNRSKIFWVKSIRIWRKPRNM